jgi:hypothetical protein
VTDPTDQAAADAARDAVATELGADPQSVAVQLLPEPVVPGLRVFSAWDASARARHQVNGVVTDGTVVTELEPALGAVLDAWAARGGPDATTRAEVVASLLLGAGIARLVDDEHPPDDPPGPVVADLVGPPEATEDRVRFWFEWRAGLARAEVERRRRGIEHEIVQAFEFENGTYDPAGFDADF